MAGLPERPVSVPDWADWLLSELDAFARIGESGKGGVCRLAGDEADGKARDHLRQLFEEAGAEVLVDAVGNMFGVFRLSETGKTAVLAGSHLDSQPTGGRFDGTYGVLAALTAARRLKESGETFRHDLVVCNWTNEEGARFTPSLTGSLVFAGALTSDAALNLADASGMTLGEALLAIGYAGTDRLPYEPVHAVEIHIEQGPRLEAADVQIGIVESAWAARKLCLAFDGAPAHTGPTPMEERRDALLAASRAICLLHDWGRIFGQGVHTSCARLENDPNSANVVPQTCTVWMEIRHPSADICRVFADVFLLRLEELLLPDRTGYRVLSDAIRVSPSLSSEGRDLAEDVCAQAGIAALRLDTVAGHDALALAAAMPSSLFFVPSRDGISHSPREFTAEADLIAGAEFLTSFIRKKLQPA